MLKYPARYKPDKIGDKDGFFLEFIDIPDAFTQAYSMEELYEMGQDVLSLMLEDYVEENREVPLPSLVKGDDIILIEPYPQIALPIVLKILRKKKKMSQKDVAEKLRVSYQTYQKMERGQEVNPTLRTIDKLAKVFDLELHMGFQVKFSNLRHRGKTKKEIEQKELEAILS